MRRSPDNAAKIVTVLTEFGFAALDVSTDTFLEPDMVVQLGRPPNRIDLLTRISGIDFEEAWPERKQALLDGIPVPMIGSGGSTALTGTVHAGASCR